MNVGGGCLERAVEREAGTSETAEEKEAVKIASLV